MTDASHAPSQSTGHSAGSCVLQPAQGFQAHLGSADTSCVAVRGDAACELNARRWSAVGPCVHSIAPPKR
jgi:hypothetical protein